MDLGTILLLMAIIAGVADMAIMLMGPRIKNFESISIILTSMGCLFALSALFWMAGLIFTNQFQYEYVFLTTNIEAPWFLKISALWAGQSGSLVFWTAVSFLLLMTYRVSVRGYEDDTIVYRAAILLALQTVLIGINALASNPFRPFLDVVQADGLGLNPLLSTIWNVIHPPIVFIAYAIAVIPFSVKLAGFTVRSEERNAEPIPVLDSLTRFMTVASWLILSLGIAIGGYWAYLVLGWGGYWAWDPVETTSLVPWLLLTGYFHARAIFKNNDVLRDSFLVFTYVTVIYATWVTRSGVLNSVHGFSISLVSWTMFATVLFNFILATILTIRAGYVDMSDDEDGDGWNFFSLSNLRDLSIKIALIGILVVLTTSVSGVVLPAVLNLIQAIIDPIGFTDNMVSIGLEFFRAGFYAGSLLLVVSAFYCMRSTIMRTKLKSVLVLALLGVGGVLAVLTIVTGLALPTYYWPANALIPVAVCGVAYLVVAFARTMAGREGGAFTMRRMGRLMLHLGIVVLLLGVFTSENVVIDQTNTYLTGDTIELGNSGIGVGVSDIDLVYWVDQYDFELHVLVHVTEGDSAWIGLIVVRGNPEWQHVTQDVYVQASALRDVFVSLRTFDEIALNVYTVDLQAKILPLVSFVWLGVFLMVMALLPLAGAELSSFRSAMKGRKEDLYGPDDEDQQKKEIMESAEN
ncbi:MAG: cytochrome c biogenesis protein CcsA [Candidatus Thorarchaeota archaeon]|jgi:cytochrome c-type biogenesis protein CcmF